jgi:transcriptional regulator with XRE-family HTH domain
MKTFNWFTELYDEVKDTFEFKLKSLEIDVTEKILRAMKNKGINRKGLADRLGTSKAAVSKLLNNGSNMTLSRLLRIAEAIECDIHLDLVPKGACSYEIRIKIPAAHGATEQKVAGIPDTYKYRVEDADYVSAA